MPLPARAPSPLVPFLSRAAHSPGSASDAQRPIGAETETARSVKDGALTAATVTASVPSLLTASSYVCGVCRIRFCHTICWTLLEGHRSEDLQCKVNLRDQDLAL